MGFFAAAPKLAAMVLFARALGDGFLGAAEQWQQVLIVIALLSVFVGAFAGLVQRNLKRLWAYSSIANVGYALIGLSAGTPEGLQAMLVFMVLYMVDVTGFFACLVALNRDGKAMETMDDMAGLIREKPALGLAMTVFAFSALGLPPLSGFWAKFYVFKAAINADLAWVAVAGLVGHEFECEPERLHAEVLRGEQLRVVAAGADLMVAVAAMPRRRQFCTTVAGCGRWRQRTGAGETAL